MIFAMATRCRFTKSLNLNRSHLCLVAAFFIFTLQLSLCGAQSQPRLSRRPAAKSAAEVSSERSAVPDQLALAAGRSDGQGRGYQRRGAAVHTRTKEPTPDYGYGQLELNLIRPEHETSSLPPQGKINGYYGGGGSLSTTAESIGTLNNNNNNNNNGDMSLDKDRLLDDSETAAEYVANAMKMAYGTRHKEQRPYNPSSTTEHKHTQQQHQQQQQHPQQQHQQQQQLEQEQLQQVKAQAQAALLEAQMQAELQTQLVEQQALLLAEQHHQQQQQQQHQHQQQQQQQQQQHVASESSPVSPAPVYEKESVPRSYEIYETPTQSEPAAAGGDIERLYRTKYYSYAPPQPYRSIESEAEEKVRVSASTEIPKAEIMKQIEKSVIKYMKELEAEGKIITTPQELAPPATKTYYKLLSLPNPSPNSARDSGEEKRSTVRPKYSNAQSGGQGRQQTASSQQLGQYHVQQQQQQQQQQPHHHQANINKPKPQRYQSETETAYQAPELSAEAMAPNVEFIYKIKTRAPLQTATVKTVSKPYTLPLKSSSEHFDHGAALKNIEEFDLSHVVTPQERERDRERERERDQEQEQRVTSKPQKLYFNSEIYHDINSLPYKGEKLRGVGSSASQIHSLQGHEYRHKLKAAGDLHPDYKGYSGYFAEPVSSSMEVSEKQPLGGLDNDDMEDGYPIPYQYVLKKEPLSSKYEEERESWESLRLAHGKPIASGYKSAGAGAGSLDYDSYSPKFNNNPEGYGYQHTYKTLLLRGGASGSPGGSQSSAGNGVKRGKRGGAAHPSSGGGAGAPGKKLLRGGPSGVGATVGVGGKHIKDLEANLALRPPPKK
ncbi:hypothetical protein ACLKA6_008228 [Drosophila palustris]